MINRSKIKEDVLNYRLQSMAIRNYLNTVPESPKKQTDLKVAATHKRRPRTALSRLAWIARAMPLLIAIVCFGVVWDGERNAARAPLPDALPAPRPLALARTLTIDPLLAQSMEPPSERNSVGRFPVTLPLPAISTGSPSTLTSSGVEIPSMGNVVSY